MPRPDEVRALVPALEPLLDEVRSELGSASRDGSHAGHEEVWRGYERRLLRLLAEVEEVACAVLAEAPDAERRVDRLTARIRAFEQHSAVIRGGAVRSLVTIPWEDPPDEHTPTRSPKLRLV